MFQITVYDSETDLPCGRIVGHREGEEVVVRLVNNHGTVFGPERLPVRYDEEGEPVFLWFNPTWALDEFHFDDEDYELEV